MLSTNLTQKGYWLAQPSDVLTLRETETCLCVANGATNKTGARQMKISTSTFTKNLQRAMYKLNTYTRAETVAEAIRQGIIGTLLVIIMLNSITNNHEISAVRTQTLSRNTQRKEVYS